MTGYTPPPLYSRDSQQRYLAPVGKKTLIRTVSPHIYEEKDGRRVSSDTGSLPEDVLAPHQGGVKMSRRSQGGMKRILVEALVIVLASWRGSA